MSLVVYNTKVGSPSTWVFFSKAQNLLWLIRPTHAHDQTRTLPEGLSTKHTEGQGGQGSGQRFKGADGVHRSPGASCGLLARCPISRVPACTGRPFHNTQGSLHSFRH